MASKENSWRKTTTIDIILFGILVRVFHVNCSIGHSCIVTHRYLCKNTLMNQFLEALTEIEFLGHYTPGFLPIFRQTELS